MQRVAIIGGGYISDCHIEAYQAMAPETVKIAAIVDVNPASGQKAAEKAGCPLYAALEEAVAAEQIDVVDVCVPTFLHDRFVIRAAELGKHVVCEKPVTLSLEQFDAMAGACKAHGVKFMTAQAARFVPEFVEIARRIRAGDLGPIHMFSESRLAQPASWNSWHSDPKKSGGGLFDINVHEIDYIYSLFGMPKRVHAIGWKSPTGCWDHVVTTMQWPELQAVSETSLAMAGTFPFSVEVRAAGDKGVIRHYSTAGDNIRDAEAQGQFSFYPAGGAAEQLQAEAYNPFQRELEGFLHAVETDGPVPVPPEETRQVLQIVLASRESLETGKVIELEE